MTSTATNATIRASHTPGPWRVGDAGSSVFGPKKADGSLAVTIANMGVRTTMADTQLVAAAPDLLAALQATDAALHILFETMNLMENKLASRVWDRIRANRAAIAKAIG